MKIRVINAIEIVLAIIFIITYFVTKTAAANLVWPVFVITVVLGILYFPFGFYTLKLQGYNTIYSMIDGVLLGSTLIAITLSLMQYDISVEAMLVLFVLFLLIPVIRLIILYFSRRKQKAQPINYNLAIMVRYLIFLAFLIYALVTYRYHHTD